jgi:hypothetical protein
MKIVIEIERLVLDGMRLNAGDGALVRSSVERELTRMISEGELGRAIPISGAVARVSGTQMPLRREPPARTGERIARSVFDGINTAMRPSRNRKEGRR